MRKRTDIRVGQRLRVVSKTCRAGDGSWDVEEFYATITGFEGAYALWARNETISQNRPDPLAPTTGGKLSRYESDATLARRGYVFID